MTDTSQPQSPEIPNDVKFLKTMLHANTIAQATHHAAVAGNYPVAIELGRFGCDVSPNNWQIHDALGRALWYAGNTDQAIEVLKHGLTVRPVDDPEYSRTGQVYSLRQNLGACLIDAGRCDEAIEEFKAILAIHPETEFATLQLAIAYLTAGKLKEGWAAHQSRLKLDRFKKSIKQHPYPMWDGKKPGRLLLVGEEGAGERIMYLSMIHELTARGDLEVIIECAHGMQRYLTLFQRSFPDAIVVPAEMTGQTKPDFQVVAATLAGMLRPNFDCFPKHTGYLVPDPAKVRRFKELLGPGPIIGVSWKSTHDTIANNKHIPFSLFAQLFDLSATFVNLQFGDTTVEQRMPCARPLHTIKGLDLYRDMDDVAALMAACDIIVTSSNTNAHIAGALGKRTITIVPAKRMRMWFWFLDRSDSPWYPQTTVLRGDPNGSWDKAIWQARGLLADTLAKDFGQSQPIGSLRNMPGVLLNE